RRRFSFYKGLVSPYGIYTSEPGDQGRITHNPDGSYDLREADGLLRHFRPDGKIDYLEDLNGNRITAQYTGEQLTRLTHSSGQFLSLSYNTAGRIVSITDSEGETTRYTYDVANEHLMSVEYPDHRIVQYTYSPAPGGGDPGTPRAHALTSIEDPSGVM